MNSSIGYWMTIPLAMLLGSGCVVASGDETQQGDDDSAELEGVGEASSAAKVGSGDCPAGCTIIDGACQEIVNGQWVATDCCQGGKAAPPPNAPANPHMPAMCVGPAVKK